jgi:hypothetical protein
MSARMDDLKLATMIRDLIVDTANNAPRSQQKAIGPSEVGEPCVRKLAYKIHDWPAVNTAQDPWASIIGTAVHAWMAEAFEGRNTAMPDGRPRYKVEERVTVRQNTGGSGLLAGSSDLYDRATGTVWDWKVVGITSLNKYKQAGPGPQYRTQAHLYGLGQENAGETPKRVAICFLPRHHELRPHVWTEPYDREVAEAGLKRLDTVYDLIYSLDPEANPQHWQLFPVSQDAKCSWCPYFKPGSSDLSQGCPGVIKARSSGFEQLIA